MKLMIGIPCGGRHPHPLIDPALRACGIDADVRVVSGMTPTANFNTLLCMAANEDCSHFIMLHSDVVPTSDGWAAMMLAIMAERKYAALSVVLPLRGDTIETSTAAVIGNTTMRMTLPEAHQLPETFGLSELRTLPSMTQASALLINDGLLLIDLAQAQPSEGFIFHDQTWLISNANGKLASDFMPEDWAYSLELARAGLPYGATTAIRAMHYGEKGWVN